MGGNPDLPIGISWPTSQGRPLDFLLQLNLSELPRELVGDALPERGWLYFFYDLEQRPWGFDVSHRHGWRVLFYDGDRKNLAPKQTRLNGSTTQTMQAVLLRGHLCKLAIVTR